MNDKNQDTKSFLDEFLNSKYSKTNKQKRPEWLISNLADIKELRSRGYTKKSIYAFMRDKGMLTCNYLAFVYYVRSIEEISDKRAKKSNENSEK